MVVLPDVVSQPVDLIIPARDECENIGAAIRAVPAGVFRRVIVVDNGSADGTGALARQAGAVVVDEPQRGYGGACLAGIAWIAKQADPPVAVAFLDADLADDPGQLPRLVGAVCGAAEHVAGPDQDEPADLAVGCRVALAEPGALDPHQRFGNQLACRLIGWATGRRFSDLGPMRVIRWEALRRLEMRDRTWGWMVEMSFKAARQELTVVEIDVPYRKRRAGASKISGSWIGSARAGTKILWTIARLAWLNRG